MKSLDLAMLSGLNKKSDKLNSFALIYDEIDNEVAKQITQWVIESNFTDDEEKPDVLNLLINSPGGSLTDAFAIIDIMNSSHIPIRTVGMGQIASAALMIFISGTKGQRILTPNTSILSHRFSAGSVGKSHELFAVAKEYDLTNQRMIEHYKKCSGLKDADIHKYLLPPEDVFLTAEEALKYHLCDRVANLK